MEVVYYEKNIFFYRGKKNYFRRGVLKVETTMERENGEVVCLGTLTGVMADK